MLAKRIDRPYASSPSRLWVKCKCADRKLANALVAWLRLRTLERTMELMAAVLFDQTVARPGARSVLPAPAPDIPGDQFGAVHHASLATVDPVEQAIQRSRERDAAADGA